MTTIVRYLSHPQVHLDPSIPVPQWGLSEVGRGRVAALLSAGWLIGTTCIVSSAETKAVETAKPIAAALGLAIVVRPAMHENDRSATGFLPPGEFEATANEFFAKPTESVRGWEPAIDAQTRIIGEVNKAMATHGTGDLLFVGHGGVGTLLLCHMAGTNISSAYDQPAGGGNYFSFSSDCRQLLHPWRPMEFPPPRFAAGSIPLAN
jgi:broad specificity phosphatase PhoE